MFLEVVSVSLAGTPLLARELHISYTEERGSSATCTGSPFCVTHLLVSLVFPGIVDASLKLQHPCSMFSRGILSSCTSPQILNCL